MNIKILKEYINHMKFIGMTPTFEDLKDYNKCYGYKLLNDRTLDFTFTKYYEEV